MRFPTFICHDVLQRTEISSIEFNALGGKTTDEVFISAMRPFEGYPVILAVLGEGLTENSECVEYIKAHPEWSPQVHGYKHIRYDAFGIDRFRRDIKVTKELIEKMFGVTPTMFIPPYNKYTKEMNASAKSIGITQIERLRKPGHFKKVPAKCTQLDFHYWSKKNMSLTYNILFYHTVKPHYVIGAPRSGTTAYMRWLENKDTLVLKEKESYWKENVDLRYKYAKLMSSNGALSVVDKNVRNSFRILDLQSIFPEAKFTHVIRDGRAAISSWRDWAVKTAKDDQSIEGAAKQWVKYVTYILANKHLLTNYEEVRYEELCFKHDYFTSRNGKWQKRLTKSELGTVMSIAGDLLRRLGYV